MSKINENWRKLVVTLFQPAGARWPLWIGVAPLFLLASATFALIAFSPYHAVVLLLALFVECLIWKVAPKLGLAAIAALVTFAFSCLPAEMRWWNGCFVASVATGLISSLYVIGEGQVFFHEREKRQEELSKDVELWQNRFSTMKEKIEEDRRLSEGEMDVLRSEMEEKKSHVASLKTLLDVVHREAAHAAKCVQELRERVVPESFEVEGKVITKEEVGRIMDDLNFYRTEHYQVNLLLEEAKEKLRLQEEAIQERQRRNQSLLGTNTKKSISLKDLVKKS